MFNNLKAEMKKQGITTNRLGKISGVTSQDLYSAISGKKPFYPKWRKAVAEALGIPENELFSDEGEV